MAEKTFKIGDVVQLNSGGPRMTVIDATGRKIRCAWFAELKVASDYFPAEAIGTPPKATKTSAAASGS